jgi:hypothetical protein
LQDPIKAGEVGEGGEVGLQGGLGGQVALSQVLALQQEKNGQGQEFGQGGFLVPLLRGELEALGLKGLELVIHPDVDGHEEGFCVKIVEGVLTILPHGTPSFFTSRGSRSSSTRRYRGLEVESEYGGVRQRWLLVESQERARMEEASLQQRIARAEGEARKVLGRLTARTFACEADARRALSEASGKLPYHRLVYLGVQEERAGERVGRPRKGEAPLSVATASWPAWRWIEGKLERARRGLGRFLLATNVLDREALPPGRC